MKIKKMVSSFIAMMLVCLSLTQGMLPASAATTTKCYTIASGYTTAYSDTSMRTKLGTIYPTDELTVGQVTGSYCRVSYPISGGRTKTGYIPTSAILWGTGGSTYTAKGRFTTYNRPGGGAYGYVCAGDQVTVLGVSGNWVQIKYPVSSGYKYAFTPSSNAQTYLYSTPEPVINSSGSWQYPVSNAYVCGNDWSQYYAPRASAGRPDHCGIDIKSRTGGTAIYAAADGTIVKAGYNSSNGNYVVIRHSLSGKTVYSFYAHLSSISRSSGSVQRGTQIGIIGNTGSSSAGVHLHFAVTDTLWSGSYYGYVPSFSGNKVSYAGVTYYNPHYIISNGALPA